MDSNRTTEGGDAPGRTSAEKLPFVAKPDPEVGEAPGPSSSFVTVQVMDRGPRSIQWTTSILDIPPELMTFILEFLDFEHISDVRQVCKTFNRIAQSILNRAFTRLSTELDAAMLAIKHMLPRRESKRRYHPLARVNEVYSVLETRFALLNMTFKRYIEDGACCFIAGKILDEAFSVLHYLNRCVQRKEQPSDTQELLKDIRDYSSMAIEYFDDHIAPTLQTHDPLVACYRSKSCFTSSRLPARSPFVGISPSPNAPSTPAASSPHTPRYNPFPHSYIEWGKISEWRKNVEEKLRVQEKTLLEQGRVIREQAGAINRIVQCLGEIDPATAAACFKHFGKLESAKEKEEHDFSVSKKAAPKRKAPEAEDVAVKKEKMSEEVDEAVTTEILEGDGSNPKLYWHL